MAVLKVAVLLYAPEVQLVVATDSGTYDISADIVSGNCTLIENQSHSFQCTLLNKGRRYDKLFKPNDRFALYLKRLQKLLIMTGYLDTVPFYSVWPRSVTIAGSSTLKRLQYHWWDPGTQASVNLFNTSGNQFGTTNSDLGMVTKATDLLTKVGGWNGTQVHFSALPGTWVTKVANLWQSVAPQIGLNPSAALGTMPFIAGNSPFTSGITTLSLINPNIKDLDGTPMPGSALPADFGTASNYQGPQDIQRLNHWYCQMQWGYRTLAGQANPNVNASYVKNALSGQKLMIGNPDSNTAVVVQIAGWGPPAGANAQIGLSPDALAALNIKPDPSGAVTANNQVQIAWILNPSKVGTGLYNPGTSNTTPINVAPTPTQGSIKLSELTGVPNVNIPLQFNNADFSSGTAGITGPAQPTSQAAQAAVGWATSVVGTPYVWGGAAPGGFDCSGLIMWAWAKAGVSLAHYTVTQMNQTAPLPNNPNYWLPGDLVFYGGSGYDGSPSAPGHVKLYIGNNQTVEAPHTGASVFVGPLDMNFSSAGRVTKANASGAGIALPGSAAGAVANTLPGGNQATNGGGTTPNTFDTAWTWFANAQQAADPLSKALTGYRALLNDTPFLPTVQSVVNATMRSFCSAPNGDFIAWFPDYFNVYNTLGCVQIADVELQDFTINWSDLTMVTHQYAAGSYNPMSLGTDVGGAIADGNMIETGGVATIDFPQILEELFNLDPNDPTFSTEGIYTRFGARPNFQPLGTLFGSVAEFWYALYLFQQNWASQFSAQVPICFMPELYPGMIMQVPSQKFQCYVEQVQHSWNLAEGGGFTTQVNITAPSAMNNAGLYGFAKGSTSAV